VVGVGVAKSRDFVESVYFHLPGDVDYGPVATTITFPRGSEDGTRRYFRIPIFNDLLFEKDETFSLHIHDVEENVHVHIKYQNVTIHDDDCM